MIRSWKLVHAIGVALRLTGLAALAATTGCAGDSASDGASVDAGLMDLGPGDGDGDGDGAVRHLPPIELGDALDLAAIEDGEWTWIDFPETRCMDDSATGLGIKVNPASDKLLIEIQGGGACFNTGTCFQVWNPDGFGADKLNGAVGRGILDSDDETNPFADWNMVFIPYCSGDIFSGVALDGTGYEGRTQAGYHNIQEYLKRLVPTFADAPHVVVSGFSAGGFASSVNWLQIREAFGPSVRVDALNDSGPTMTAKYLSPCLEKRLAELWNWSALVPESCTDCDIDTGFVSEPLLEWSIERTPDGLGRHGIISSDEDAIIKLFFGYGLNDCENIDDLLPPVYPDGLYAEGLLELHSRFDGRDWAQIYVVDSEEHTWTTTQSPGDVVSGGVTLSDWIGQMLDPESDWQSVIPEL